MTLFDGTLPVRPYHPDGFVGKLTADGQEVKVAALACDEDRVVVLSLVGFDTSIGAALATLWSNTAVTFAPSSSWQNEWQGPDQFSRLPTGYRQPTARLEGTREVHGLALVKSAHLMDGILNPVNLPEPERKTEPEPARPGSPVKLPRRAPLPRYLLGNWDELTPHQRNFLGHLYALHLVFLHRHAEHPEWVDVWADGLWQHGLARDLIVPLPSLGIRAWKLSGELYQWSNLVSEGVCEGWLPWR